MRNALSAALTPAATPLTASFSEVTQKATTRLDTCVPRYGRLDALKRRLRLTASIQAWFQKLSLALLLLALPGAGLAQVTEYATPTPFSQPLSITAGPDGALWFVELHAKIARSTVLGSITEYALPGTFPVDCGTAFANAITTGPDGALWFICSGYVGRITTGGTVTGPYMLPNLLSGANSI